MTQTLAGIGKKGRSQLAKLLKANLSTITPKNAAIALQVGQHQASQLLAEWARKGWLSRVKHGVYIPVSLQADTTRVMADEPWVIAKSIYDPCYIGGWSAAEHWDLTEQIFNSTMVFSTKKTAKKNVAMNGLRLTLKTISPQRLFGTKNFWIGSQKVILSDPTKTIVDAFNSPEVVGGIRMTVDILKMYMKSEHKNLDLLFQYATKMNNSAIFKRLGYVFETSFPSDSEFINKLKKEIKSGYSQLDPNTPGTKLVTKWNLWVPALEKGKTDCD